jgi:hypothetical protein
MALFKAHGPGQRSHVLAEALPIGLNLRLNFFRGKCLAGQIGATGEPDGRA